MSTDILDAGLAQLQQQLDLDAHELRMTLDAVKGKLNAFQVSLETIRQTMSIGALEHRMDFNTFKLHMSALRHRSDVEEIQQELQDDLEVLDAAIRYHPPPYINYPERRPFVVSQKSFPPHDLGTLSDLPNELILMIFSHLHPLDKLNFALSCQSSLNISAMAHLQIPEKPTELGIGSFSGLMAAGHELRHFMDGIQPRLANGKPNEAWGLCVDCLRYRPTQEAYWIGRDLEGEYKQKGKPWYADWIAPVCPECRAVERKWKSGKGYCATNLQAELLQRIWRLGTWKP